MKKISSIKTRITIWYTTLMFVLIAIVLSLVGSLSYHLSIENIEKDLKSQVYQISEKIRARLSDDIFTAVESYKEFKSVTIYRNDGKYVVGKYNYDVSGVPFRDGVLRRESIEGKDYLIYDVFKSSSPKDNRGYWIRGAESINSAMIFGRSVFLVILVVIPLIILLTALGGYYITKKAFSPINDIAQTAKSINAQNDIKKRIPINADSRDDELKKLSITLNEMLDKIEYVINQEKQFTSDASHELRTPVSVILAQGEYLLDITKNEKERELAENIVSKAKQVTKLISRLILLARIDNNRQKFNKEKIDASLLVDIANEEMKEIADTKDIKVSVNSADDTYLYADESLLLSAISNLLSNAIKYGKQSGNVDISVSKSMLGVEIRVKDDGVGISRENHDKIWGRFYRVDDARNDEYESYGLGLAMVKSIVELHGGSIYVESELDKGTEFTMILPEF